MNERRPEFGASSDPSGGDAVDRLAVVRGPAVVVAPDEALLVAANPAGAAMLGVPPGTDQAVPLDCAMPAIMDLRRMSASIPADHPGDWLPLVFWTSTGIARASCRLRRLVSGDQRRLVLIEFESAAIAAEAAVTSPRGRPDDTHRTAIAANEQDASPPSLDAPTSPQLRKPMRPAPTVEKHAGHRNEPAAITAVTPPVAASVPIAEPAEEQSPPPPPLVRSDHDTLKAIARQILAGRRPPVSQERPALPTEAQSHTEHATEEKRAATKPPAQRPAIEHAHAARGSRDAAASTVRIAAHTPATAVRRATATTTQEAAAPSETPPAARKVGKSNAAGTASATPHAGRPGTVDPPPPKQGSESRRTMVRRLAHELKTPVSAIVTAAEIMKDERLGPIGDERYLRYARDIHASARHALDVIERLLGQKSSPSERREFSFTDVDLAILIANLASSFELLARERDVSIGIAMPPHLPRVVADATSLRQIVLNLLGNALKFTPHGGRVEISVKVAAAGPLVLAVTDSGPGMSDEEIARILAGIEAPAGEDKRPGGGLGIGLPLARSLAEANGASLQIETGRKAGTRVELVFPSARQIVG